MQFKIAVLPGDGIGPEIIDAGVEVLNAIGKKYGHTFKYEYGLIGGVAIGKEGTALSDATIAMCKRSDAVFFGAVGDPKYDNPLAKIRPEDGILKIRKALGLFANLRPVKVFSMLENASSLKPEIVSGVDFIVIRELTGGLYFGKPKKRWETSTGRKGVDTMAYSEKEIERVLRVGFELARTRRKKLTSVDKANVLETSRLWRTIAHEMAPHYPDVQFDDMLVDSAAMRIIQQPKYFDVMVMENTFGDILTDEASMLAGSLGMLPSASLAAVPKAGTRIFGLYEPIHGSAPKHAGLNEANPIATIMSASMMMRYSLGLVKEADALDAAIEKTLKANLRTYDIMGPGSKKLGTKEMGKAIAERV